MRVVIWIEMCKKDGSTPLGQCPWVEIEAADSNAAMSGFYRKYPDHEIVSYGWKSDIVKFNEGSAHSRARPNPVMSDSFKV